MPAIARYPLGSGQDGRELGVLGTTGLRRPSLLPGEQLLQPRSSSALASARMSEKLSMAASKSKTSDGEYPAGRGLSEVIGEEGDFPSDQDAGITGPWYDSDCCGCQTPRAVGVGSSSSLELSHVCVQNTYPMSALGPCGILGVDVVWELGVHVTPGPGRERSTVQGASPSCTPAVPKGLGATSPWGDTSLPQAEPHVCDWLPMMVVLTWEKILQVQTQRPIAPEQPPSPWP